MTLPHFFIIGAMKAGSTTLHECLRRHPGIFMCPNKEPQYFSRDHVFAKGLAWYESLFEGAVEGQIVGESSTCYSRSPVYPETVDRIAEHVPAARFVYVLRHPVERFHSHYGHRVREMVFREEGSVPSLDRFIEEDEEAFVAGLYDEQIRRYEQRFASDRIRVVLFEDLKSSPREALEALQVFIGVDPIDLTENGRLPRRNKRIETSRRGAARRMLYRTRRGAVASALRTVLPTSLRRHGSEVYFRTLLGSPISARQSRRIENLVEPLTEERRAVLVDRYRASVDRLEERLGRSLSDWKR